MKKYISQNVNNQGSANDQLETDFNRTGPMITESDNPPPYSEACKFFVDIPSNHERGISVQQFPSQSTVFVHPGVSDGVAVINNGV